MVGEQCKRSAIDGSVMRRTIFMREGAVYGVADGTMTEYLWRHIYMRACTVQGNSTLTDYHVTITLLLL